MKFIAYWFSHCLGKKKHINYNSAPEPPRQLGETVILTYTITNWAAEFSFDKAGLYSCLIQISEYFLCGKLVCELL